MPSTTSKSSLPSCGTESDTTAPFGLAQPERNQIVTTAGNTRPSHSVNTGKGGLHRQETKQATAAARHRRIQVAVFNDRVAIVSAMWANNETTGTIFPVEMDTVQKPGIHHTDAVQVVGR